MSCRLLITQVYNVAYFSSHSMVTLSSAHLIQWWALDGIKFMTSNYKCSG